MKKTESNPKRPTKKALDLHVEKAMKASRTRMRINSARLIAKALHDVWAEADNTSVQERASNKCRRTVAKKTGKPSKQLRN